MKAQEAPIQKDLETVLQTFQQAIPQREAFEFELTPLDRLGIPLWGAFVWADDGDFSDGFGYGADTLAARVSAWGEVLENYFATKTLETMPRRRASFNELIALGEKAVNPVSLCLDAGVNYSHDKEIVWTTGKSFPAGETVWLPLEAVAITSSDARKDVDDDDFLFKPITNGLGAGATLEQALAHGILELVQRDGDSVTFRAMDEGVKIELDDVKDEETRNLLRFLDESGVEVIPKLAGIVAGIPVIYLVGYDRDLSQSPFHLSLSACGEAAHPDKERALAKALREFVSSRARKRFMHGSIEDMKRVAPKIYCDRVISDPLGGDEPRALESLLAWVQMTREEFFNIIKSPLFEVRRTVNFAELPTANPEETNTAENLMSLLADRLSGEAMEIYYADFTPAGSDFAVVKAIVPGLEVETMSYNRIGRRNFERLLERGQRDNYLNGLVGVGDAPKDALPIHLTAKDEEKIGGKVWLNPKAVEKAVGKLYALYREPNGHTIGKVLNQEP
jgi:thiazole/oxazole-forming peptide maturase SagD family component